jgi:hypothetical protein
MVKAPQSRSRLLLAFAGLVVVVVVLMFTVPHDDRGVMVIGPVVPDKGLVYSFSLSNANARDWTWIEYYEVRSNGLWSVRRARNTYGTLSGGGVVKRSVEPLKSEDALKVVIVSFPVPGKVQDLFRGLRYILTHHFENTVTYTNYSEEVHVLTNGSFQGEKPGP